MQTENDFRSACEKAVDNKLVKSIELVKRQGLVNLTYKWISSQPMQFVNWTDSLREDDCVLTADFGVDYPRVVWMVIDLRLTSATLGHAVVAVADSSSFGLAYLGYCLTHPESYSDEKGIHDHFRRFRGDMRWSGKRS